MTNPYTTWTPLQLADELDGHMAAKPEHRGPEVIDADLIDAIVAELRAWSPVKV